MSLHEQLQDLARNLYWVWHPEVIEIFRDLDPQLWREVNHNPAVFLARLSPEEVERKAEPLTLQARVTHALHQLEAYLEASYTWGACQAGVLRVRPVAYFSAEFGLHESLPIYSGGLGVLAGDHLKSASDLGVPLVGVGLFYAKGYFDQRLDADGRQQEAYFAADVNSLPIDLATDDKGKPLVVTVRTRPSEVRVKVWTAAVGRCRLVLLDTHVDGNRDEDKNLTAQLYGGGVQVRIRQELVLGVAGMRALAALGIQPGVLHLNEGHCAFAVLEQARRLMERDGRPFGDVAEQAAAGTVFTTHTPIEAGHDRFAPDLVEEVLGPTREALGLAPKDFLALGRRNPDDAGEPFCMTVLALKMSRYRNGVSALHGRVSRAMWRGLWPSLPVDRVPIGHITNGVHVASWLAAPMAGIYRDHLGPDWEQHLCTPETWHAMDEVDEEEFWQQHQTLKTSLVNFVRRRLRTQAEQRGEEEPRTADGRPLLDPDVFTVGFARRFASYKRATLLFTDLERLDALVNHADRPMQVIFAGKAHPNDSTGKDLLRQVIEVTRQKRFRERMVFVENHDINVARHLAQGVDLWLNTPRRPNEACGTSGQKAVLNGGLNASVLDGWWAEAWDGANGFAIGDGAERADTADQDRRDAQTLYDLLEHEALPLFYDRNARGVPHGWIRRQMAAVRTLAWRFCARRMVMDYTERCYVPAAGGATASVPGRAGP